MRLNNQSERVQVIPTKIHRIALHLAFILGLFLVQPFQGNAQVIVDECDELVCNGDLQISLNVACELFLTPDMLLEAPLQGNYTVQLFSHHGDYLRNDYLTADDAGEIIKYQISCGGNSCWGEIIVEANVVPQFESPCGLTEDGSIPDDCILWCGPIGKVPASLVTPEEVAAAFGNCGPDLLGDIRVTETRTGDICSPDGEVVLLVYTGKVIQHGSIRTVDILTQQYTTKKLDVNLTTFSFPDNVILDCDYLEQIEVPEGETAIHYELGEPASIYASQHDQTVAYPYYIDIHDTVLNIVRSIDTTLIVVDQMLRDTMVKENIGGEVLWVLKTIVDKVYEEEYTEVFDTVGKTNPIVPVVDRVCNVLSGYSDIEFDACGQGKKIVRTWNLIDWCDANTTISGRQTIEIKDVTAPVIVELVNGEYVPIPTIDDVVILSDVSVSIEPWSCSAKLKLPTLNIHDNCDDTPTVHWDSNEGVVVDGYIVDLWLGQSPIVIAGTVVDDCGNQTYVSFNAIVVDDVPPVPVCEAALQVSLTGNSDSFGAGKIYADAIDEGSHDTGCGKVTITVVRMEDWREVIRDCQDNIVGYAPKTCSPITANVDLGAPVFKNDCEATGVNIAEVTVPGDYVNFCCADLGQIVQVIMFVEDENGNVNQCMVSIEVVDKSAPTLICEDQVISCTDGDYLTPPAMLGSSCERENPYEVLLLSESKSNNVCAGGQTVREWYVDLDNSNDFSPGDAYCQQVVQVDADTAFNPYTIKWPKSYDGKQLSGLNLEVNDEGEIVEIPKTIAMGDPAACTPDGFGNDDAQGDGDSADGSGLGAPVWCDTECGLVGYSMEADTIKASDACLKIIRRWTVLDWCTYNPNGSDVDDENDTSTDSFEPIEDWAQFEPNAVGCPTYAPNIGDAVYLRYTDVEQDGYYTYDQVIVVNDDTAPEIDGPATYVVNSTGGATTKDDAKDCTGEDVISASASDLCGGEMTGSDLLQWDITVSKDGVVVASKTSRGAQATMGSQIGSPGDTHIITWRVKDGCGNASSAQTIVTFGDQQAPTPFCVSGLTTAFMASDGTVAVWGQEFDFGSFDNCTENSDLRFSLVPEGEQPIAPGEVGFEDQKGITFSCTEFTSFERLDVWVWDEVGNGDFCSVGLLLADNGNQCAEIVEEEVVEEEVVEEEVVEEEVVEEEVVEGECSLTNVIVNISNTIQADVFPPEVAGAFGGAGTDNIEVDFGEASGAVNSIFSAEDTELFYDISVGDGTISLEAISTFGAPFARILEPGTHDRYYFNFDSNINITNVTVLSESTSDIGDSRITYGENQIVVDFGPGLLVGFGFDAFLTFEYECEQAGSGAMIAGSIQTSYGEMIDQVEVTAQTPSLSEYPVFKMTNDNGEYAFENNPLDYNYSITAAKEDSYMTGVSTLDLVMISRHIIGVEEFKDPYKIIAADASADRRVSAVDLGDLKRLILGVKEELTKTEPWVFISENQVFFDEENPWPFTQKNEIQSLSTDMMDENFIGVKIGDVDQSYKGVESRTSGILTMQTTNQVISNGQLVELAVSSSNFSEVFGYQFTLDHKDLIFKEIRSGALELDETSVGVMNERLTMSWFEGQAQSLANDQVLFTLVFEAENNVDLKTALSLNSKVTANEAYVGSDFSKFEIALELIDDVIGFELLQNQPNPFESNTVIGFRLDQASIATLRIYDLAGKTIHTVNGSFTEGLNEIKIDAKDLGISGLLYYQLESNEKIATKKMIVLPN